MRRVKKTLLFLMVCLMVQMGCVSVVSAAGKTKLNRTSISMTVGTTCNLKLLNNKKAVKWSTSAADRVSVRKTSKNSVQLVAKKAGTVKIKAKVGKKTYVCTVKVKAKPIALSAKTVNLFVGDTYELSLKNNTKSVRWSTSNKKYASIKKLSKNKVRITAKKAGTVKVKAKVSGKTYTCTIKIKNRTRVSSIALSYSGKLVEGNTIQVVAKLTPANATNKKIIWSSSNTAVATVNAKGIVSLKKAGNVTITAKSEDSAVTKSVSFVVDAKSVAQQTEAQKESETTKQTEVQTEPQKQSETMKPAEVTEKQTEVVPGGPNETEKIPETNSSVQTEPQPVETEPIQTEPIVSTETEPIETEMDTEIKALREVKILGLPGGMKVVGTSFVLSTDVEGSLQWESDNPSVAVVDSNGQVSCQGKGLVTISCISTDGKWGANISFRVYENEATQLPEEWQD